MLKIVRAGPILTHFCETSNGVEQACTTQKTRSVILININLPWAAKVYFIALQRFLLSLKDILNRQLIILSRVFQTFLQLRKLSRATTKAFTGHMLYRPGVEPEKK